MAHRVQQLVSTGSKGVGQGLRELRDFYELDDDTLWVTMSDGHL